MPSRAPTTASAAFESAGSPATVPMKRARIESLQQEAAGCCDRRSAQDIAQERDLAKRITGAEAADPLPGDQHLHLAAFDHVEAVTMIALREDRRARSQLELVREWHRDAREPLPEAARRSGSRRAAPREPGSRPGARRAGEGGSRERSTARAGWRRCRGARHGCRAPTRARVRSASPRPRSRRTRSGGHRGREGADRPARFAGAGSPKPRRRRSRRSRRPPAGRTLQPATRGAKAAPAGCPRARARERGRRRAGRCASQTKTSAPPTTPPTPTAAVSAPTPDWPSPSSWSAVTTIRTFRAPATKFCAPQRTTTIRVPLSPATARAPARASLMRPLRDAASARGSCRGVRIGISRSVETRYAADAATKTMPMLVPWRAPLRSRPRNTPQLSITDSARLFDVSSSGVRDSHGKSEFWAGRITVERADSTPASA